MYFVVCNRWDDFSNCLQCPDAFVEGKNKLKKDRKSTDDQTTKREWVKTLFFLFVSSHFVRSPVAPRWIISRTTYVCYISFFLRLWLIPIWYLPLVWDDETCFVIFICWRFSLFLLMSFSLNVSVFCVVSFEVFSIVSLLLCINFCLHQSTCSFFSIFNRLSIRRLQRMLWSEFIFFLAFSKIVGVLFIFFGFSDSARSKASKCYLHHSCDNIFDKRGIKLCTRRR